LVRAMQDGRNPEGGEPDESILNGAGEGNQTCDDKARDSAWVEGGGRYEWAAIFMYPANSSQRGIPTIRKDYWRIRPGKWKVELRLRAC